VCLLSFFVSVFSISVGGTSLITVPLLIALGMASRNAVATNMFALIFLSLSGALGFRKEIKKERRKRLVLFSILTIFGSIIGAHIVLALDEDILRKVIGAMIIVISGSLFLKKELGLKESREEISMLKFVFGAISVFALGIYGGFFSGGYVTLLTLLFVLVFGFNFLQAVSVTKVFNVFSSLVACAIFYYHGLVDFSVGIPLALSMSSGAYLGTMLALRKGSLWIKYVFVMAAVLLAAQLLLF